MRYTIGLALLLMTGVLSTHGQQAGSLGDCHDYDVDGNRVVFSVGERGKVLVQVLHAEVLKIWIAPDGKFERNNPSFAVVNEDLGFQGEVNVHDAGQQYEIFTDRLRIRVQKSPFSLQVFDKFQKLLLGDYQQRGFVQEGSRVATYKTLRSDEQFFGLGEKAGPVDRRGRAYKMWNSDKPCYGVDEDPLYKSIPFFMSSYRYGVFFDNTYKTEFKFGTESPDYFSFEAPDGEMLYYFLWGQDYKQLIGHYTALTGKPLMPPKWAFGFSQCRGDYTFEHLARDVADEFRKRRIPCDIIYQDIGWVAGLQDFNWNPERYDNPAKMVSDLADMGYKLVVSQDPVISQQNGKQWREADSLGYFTRDTRTGKTYDMPWPWGGNCGVVDFTHPDVADWWGTYQQKPLDIGVRGFWTDMGEPAWSNEEETDRLFMKHHAGMHDEIHNVYGHTWDKVVTEQFNKRNPGKRVFQMTRSAYAGMQRYTFGWSGDAGNGNDVLDGWANLAGQIPVGVSAGMGLIPFWSCDISGYCGDITDPEAMAQLYIRWMQFGVFNPLSRAHHEGSNVSEPWAFGDEAERLSREAIELKYRLFPYHYTYARKAHDTGVPMMRATLLEYPNDREATKADGQFFMGEELLVAPVVEKDAVTKDVYLPEGEWVDYNDKQTVHRGGRWITVDAPLHVIPLFAKKGSIIPTMPVMQYIHELPVYPLILDIFPAQPNREATFECYEDDGETTAYLDDVFAKTAFSCRTEQQGYTLRIGNREERGYQVTGKRNLLFRIHLAQKPKQVSLDGKKLKRTKPGSTMDNLTVATDATQWAWDEAAKTILVRLPDTGEARELQVR